MKISLFFIFVVSMMLRTCSFFKDDENREVLATVGKENIYLNDVLKDMPESYTGSDSVDFIHHYVEEKIKRKLLYDMAKENVSDTRKINDLVEKYRRSLFIYEYQHSVLNEKLENEITDSAVTEFYDKNLSKFLLEEPLVKGLLVKVPMGAPKIDSLKLWVKNPVPSNMERLELYSVQNAVKFEYFQDKWMPFSMVKSNLINEIPEKEASFLRKYGFFEDEDSEYLCVVNITDCVLSGAPAPFEYCFRQVKNLLIKARELDYLLHFEEMLYDNAVKSGQVTFK